MEGLAYMQITLTKVIVDIVDADLGALFLTANVIIRKMVQDQRGGLVSLPVSIRRVPATSTLLLARSATYRAESA